LARYPQGRPGVRDEPLPTGKANALVSYGPAPFGGLAIHQGEMAEQRYTVPGFARAAPTL